MIVNRLIAFILKCFSLGVRIQHCTDLYAKRPLCDSGYYATFNRDNVELVSVKETPIVELTPTGIRTSDGVEHELDVLIFATGFDAVDGNYTRMDIRGRSGETIQEHWKDGPTSYLGVTTAGRVAQQIAAASRRHMTLRELERLYVLEVLRQAEGNKSRAAEILGLDRKTLYRKLKHYKIES